MLNRMNIVKIKSLIESKILKLKMFTQFEDSLIILDFQKLSRGFISFHFRILLIFYFIKFLRQNFFLMYSCRPPCVSLNE